MALQVKLLRVLQERVLERVGGNETIPVDVRLITATHRDLEAQVRRGELRADLFYRINVVPITLPTLRERREDIGPLVEHFLEQHRIRAGKEQRLRLSPAALRRLEQHSWPGNVRELQNVIERLVALHPPGSVIEERDVSLTDGLLADPPGPDRATDGTGEAAASATPALGSLKDRLERIENQILATAMDRHAGNKSRAARELGLSRQALQQKLSRLGPPRGEPTRKIR
jgi:transcriptional regulator with PAS, ATPase and Fis domain